MKNFYIILSALIIVIFNILQTKDYPSKFIKSLNFISFLIIGFRYIILIIFTLSNNINLIKILSYIYIPPTIGLIIPSALALWYIIPRFREKIKEWIVVVIISPFIIFYFILIYYSPFQLINQSGLGYRLELISPWINYLMIVQGIFIFLIIFICILGCYWYRYKFPRSQYLLFILGYILIFIDGLSIIFKKLYIIEPLILSESFVLIAILYAFSTNPIKYKYRD
ncbi:hypothetical protein [Defluviitalea phaphyphila]|uniref:hypothetical protein n=1 Tax=Defluviitalea phaphyphila TaxID=1473580 RepID=UPI000730953A|nr:hypothetical protein [Defluviitalea phaphyphila]